MGTGREKRKHVSDQPKTVPWEGLLTGLQVSYRETTCERHTGNKKKVGSVEIKEVHCPWNPS